MKLFPHLAILAVLSLCSACGSEAESAESPAPAPAAPAPAASPPAASDPAPSAPAAGGGSVCERAASCCTAYIDAMVALSPAMAGSLDPETTCAGVRQAGASGSAGDVACQAAIDGWRQGLTAMPNATIPAACE